MLLNLGGRNFDYAPPNESYVAIAPQADQSTIKLLRGTTDSMLTGQQAELFDAFIKDDAECVRREMEKEASPSLGKSLFMAAETGAVKAAKVLLELGADANVQSDGDHTGGESVLIAAAAENQAEIVALLLEHNANIHFKDPQYGHTAFTAASTNGKFQASKVLLEGGSDINHCAISGVFALLAAAEDGELDLVVLLIEHGCDVNQSNPVDARTPLAAAVEHGHTAIAHMLIENGATLLCDDDNGGNNPAYIRTVCNSRRLAFAPLMRR